MKKIILLALLLCSLQQGFGQQRYFKYRFYALEEAKADSLEKLRERRNSKIEQDSEGMVMLGKKKYQLINAFDSSLIRKKMKYTAPSGFLSRGGFGRVTFAKPNRVILEQSVVKAYFRYEKNTKAIRKMNLASVCDFVGPGLFSIGLASSITGAYVFLENGNDGGPFYKNSGFIVMTGGFTLLAGAIVLPGISHRLYKESIKAYNSGLTKKKKTKTAMLMPQEFKFGMVQTAFAPATPIPAIGFRWKL